jgi:hypothetical protein
MAEIVPRILTGADVELDAGDDAAQMLCRFLGSM